MVKSKAEYEMAVGRPLTDAEYAKLAGIPSLHAKIDGGPSPWGNAHATSVPLPAPQPDPMLMIAPKPGQEPPPTPQPIASFEAAKKGGLAAFVTNPQGFTAQPIELPPVNVTAPVEVAPQYIPAAPKPAPKPMYAGGAPAAPAAPINVGNFGKTPHEIDAEKQGQKHAINQLNYQNQASDAEIAQAGEFEQIAKNAADAADAKMRAAEQSAAKRKAFLDTYNSDTMRAVEEYSKAEIDPNKYWHDRGTGGTILAAVGVALGGWASALAARAGQRMDNAGVEMIEKGISRDIEAQKANIAKKGAGIEARKGLYGMYLQQFGSEDAAEAMAYETYLRKTKAEIDAQAAKTTNEQVKIRAAALSESLEDRIIQAQNRNMIAGEKMYDSYLARKAAAAAAAEADMRKRNQAIFDANLKAVGARVEKMGGAILPAKTDIPLPGGGVIPAGIPVAYNAKGEVDMSGTEALHSSTVNVPVLQPGGGVAYQPMAVDKAGFGDASKKASGAADAIGAIERMEKAAAMGGPWVGTKLAEYNAAMADYVNSYAVAKGMGQVSESEEARVKATITDAPTWLVGYWSDKQKTILANQKQALADQAKSAAITHGPASAAGPAPITSAGPAQ